MWKFSVSNISSPETTDGGVLSLASSSIHHWPLQPPERCGFLLFSFYSLPVIMTKEFREDVMLEIHSLLRMAVSTPRYSSRCGVPHAVLVFLAPVTWRRVSPPMPTKASFPASKNTGFPCSPVHHFSSHLPLPPISIVLFTHVFFLSHIVA